MLTQPLLVLCFLLTSLQANPAHFLHSKPPSWLASTEKECSPSIFHSLFPSNSPKYTITDHHVQTSDGYTLRLFRIHLSPSEQAKLPLKLKKNIGQPVHMQHGLTGSADEWFINGEGASIGFYFVNKGYDVWVGNNRGCKYSKGHVRPDISSKDYWDFSFTEMGLYDVPAFYKYILGNYDDAGKKIIYLGLSEGTSQMFAGQTDPYSKGFLEERTLRYVAIGPIVYLTESTKVAAEFFAKFEKVIWYAANVVGQHSIVNGGCEDNARWTEVLQWACEKLEILCNAAEFIIGGIDSRVDNVKNMLAKFLDHNPSGASAKSFAHYAQLINGGPRRSPIFRKFDYGVIGNWRNYGQASAPDFDLGSIKVPINIIAEGKDPLGTAQNIQNFLPKLPKGSWTLDTIEGWEHTSCMYPLDPELIFRIFEKILD